MNDFSRTSLFVDTADREAGERWLGLGMFAGLTTNPKILAKCGRRLADIPSIWKWARAAGAGEVFFQAWGPTAEDLYDSANRILEVAPGASIKVPCTIEGVRAAARLKAQDVPVLVTAVFCAKQALIAAGVGADYIAPYYHQMQAQGRDALAEVARMVDVLPQDGENPWILAASFRSPRELVDLAGVGVKNFTVSPATLAELFEDELTTSTVAAFEQCAADLGPWA